MSGPQIITISEDDDGQRLDRWLKKRVPFALAQKLIRKGAVKIDGKKAKPDSKLQAGQEVRLPALEDKPEKITVTISEKDERFIRSCVIYEDDYIIAFDKPSGIASQGGTKSGKHIDAMLNAFTDKKGVKPRLVHRLDKETSGIMVVAKTAEMARELGHVFKGKQLKKIYWAVVSPAPEMNDGEIMAPIMKAGGPNKENMIVAEAGQPAHTLFEVIERTGQDAAFVAFWPRTGRTHQIRVHAQYMGCPVLGDYKYGFKAESLEDLEIADRLHLHAASLSFRHPGTGKMLTLEAPLPKDLVKTWESLGFQRKPEFPPFDEIELL